VLGRRKFFHGRQIRGSECKDLTWFRPDGREMAEADWHNYEARALGVRMAGDALDEVDRRGHPVVDDIFLLLLNAHHEPLSFVLPNHGETPVWDLVLDTRESLPSSASRKFKGGGTYELEARSLALLRLRKN